MPAQLKSFRSHAVQLRGGKGRLVPVYLEMAAVLIQNADIAPAEVIRENEDNIGFGGGGGQEWGGRPEPGHHGQDEKQGGNRWLRPGFSVAGWWWLHGGVNLRG